MAESKRLKIYNLTKGRCFYCGCKLDIKYFHMDHFIPKQAGGKSKGNLVPCCHDCNLSKGSLPLDYFRDKIQGLLTETHHGRLIANYYGIKPTPIKFFFEEVDDGDIQNNINEFLDGQQGCR